MCNKVKEVVSSHLIPAKVYDYIRPPGGHPIAVSSEFVISTDRQTQAPLLCKDCECILNRGGEAWLLSLLAEHDGKFPLYEILTRQEPQIFDGDSKGYAAANNPEIDCERLAHFAMGVFWKAAVHSWRKAKETPMIDLGQYRESARAFLTGEGPFPDRMTLTIGILPPPVKAVCFEYPYRGSEREWHNFLFYIPGIRFVLCVRKGIRRGMRNACFVKNPAHPIIVKDFGREILKAITETLRSEKNLEKFKRLVGESKQA
jgi:hypothetical protein